jgi:positive regulator of sigma E activity
MPVWVRLRHKTEEATASGIYGLIVGAAVLVASHATTAVRTVIAVLVTLTIYWLAERYARIVAERIHEGQRCGAS